MRPFNFTDGPRPAGRSPEERARFYRWNAPGKSRVIHPDHGSVVVPHVSNLAATMNAAEVWGVRLGGDHGRRGVGRGSFGAGGRNATTI